MKFMEKAGSLLIMFLCMLSPVSVSAEDINAKNSNVSQDLTYYCANKDVEFQESVRIFPGRRVLAKQNTFLLVEQQEQVLPDKNLIKSQLLDIGIDDDCAEYLLTQGVSKRENLARVYFKFDRDNLTEESIYVLDTLVKNIRDNALNLSIEGHTDSIGSKGYNFSLGMRRAESVKKYLIENNLDRTKLHITSLGETKPIASNKTPDGRKQNRRVDILQK